MFQAQEGRGQPRLTRQSPLARKRGLVLAHCDFVRGACAPAHTCANSPKCTPCKRRTRVHSCALAQFPYHVRKLHPVT